MSEIRNKVKESGLIQLDLAIFKSKIELIGLDISTCLWQGLVLKEKDFRTWIKEHDWDIYSDKAVYVYCSADAIIPGWAYMLISSELIQRNIVHVIGNLKDLEKELYKIQIQSMNIDDYEDGRVIIKGCSDISDPDFVMNEVLKRILPKTKSIMFGEPCSTVPVFKKK